MNLKKLITIIATLSLLIGTGDMPIVHAEDATSMDDKISLENTTQVEEFNNDASNENNDASESTDTTNETEDKAEDEPKDEDQSDEDIEEESDEKTYEDTEEESDAEIDNETNDSKDKEDVKEDVTFSFLNLTTYQVIGLFDQAGNYYEESTYMGESNVCDKECTTKALIATALEYSNNKNQIEAYLDNHITLPEICPDDYKIVIYLDIDGNITNARAFSS